MKFLNVFCERRKAIVYISLDKIVLVTKSDDGESCMIELAGTKEAVEVAMTAESIVRKINGEDKSAIGFRSGQSL